MDYEYWLKVACKTHWKFYERIISNYTIRTGAKSSSKNNIKENQFNMETVQERYLNKIELVVASVIKELIQIYNKTTR
jgi:hypothetical protein